MRVAVYGGSFDPPHIGHLLVASWILWTGRAQQVWLVPAFDHPFQKRMAPHARRIELCRRVAAQVDGVDVSDIEGTLPVPSYSIDTLRALRGMHPEHDFRFVLGADNLDSLHQWKEWRTIDEEFEPIVVGRQGYPDVPDSPAFPGVSSTEVRRRARRGESIDAWVPDCIVEDVRGLYVAGSADGEG
ncbi:MAG: nicotinate (nicotinamide) nucleotide adenylyltransferase [Myxococcales bacterium]|nr:nicotinate (nicotinamide) nucleotide adenylyltransferase [Myxococcales bacterium]